MLDVYDSVNHADTRAGLFGADNEHGADNRNDRTLRFHVKVSRALFRRRYNDAAGVQTHTETVVSMVDLELRLRTHFNPRSIAKNQYRAFRIACLDSLAVPDWIARRFCVGEVFAGL